MNVWRVSFRSGIDGSDNPGRWNEKGIKVLYTSANPSLCAWEYFAHQVSRDSWPTGLKLMQITIPEQHEDIIKLPVNALPAGWNRLRYQHHVQQVARTELINPQRLGIWLPSVVIPEDFNLILNPYHVSYAELVKRITIVPFNYDNRFRFIFD